MRSANVENLNSIVAICFTLNYNFISANEFSIELKQGISHSTQQSWSSVLFTL